MKNEIFKEKLKFFLKAKGISQKEIAERTNSTSSQVNNLISGRDKFGLGLAKTWGEILDIDPLWLMTQGDQGLPPGTRVEDTKLVEESKTGLPYFDMENIECGVPGGFGKALEYSRPDGYFQFPWVRNDGNTFCVRAHGNSMINLQDPIHSICHGSYIALRHNQVSAIQWGEVYALATADGYVVKKLMPSDREGCVKCVSFNNEEYPPYDLLVEEIYDYAIVVGVATINLW